MIWKSFWMFKKIIFQAAKVPFAQFVIPINLFSLWFKESTLNRIQLSFLDILDFMISLSKMIVSNPSKMLLLIKAKIYVHFLHHVFSKSFLNCNYSIILAKEYFVEYFIFWNFFMCSNLIFSVWMSYYFYDIKSQKLIPTKYHRYLMETIFNQAIFI